MRLKTRGLLSAVALCLLPLSCKSKASESAQTSAPPAASSGAALPAPKRHNWPAPSGPVLAVLAGQGVGAIRIGATPATIERLMEAPCEVKTETVCRYLGRGIEFNLEGGVTKTIHVYRAGRPSKDQAGNAAEFGFFRGAIPPDLQLGMIPSAIQEHLGPPLSIDKRDGAKSDELAETHHYEGLDIGYDRLENGNLVMSEISIFKAANVPAASASSAPKALPSASASAKARPKLAPKASH